MERKRGEISLFYFVGDYFASASMDDDVPTASASGRLVCHVGNGAQFYRKQEKPPDFLRSQAVIRGSASNWDQAFKIQLVKGLGPLIV